MSKKDLLKEELKRHMQLLEYTFYLPEADSETGEDEEVVTDDGEQGLLFDTDSDLVFEQDPAGEIEEPVGGAEEVVDTEIVTPAGGEEVVDTEITGPTPGVEGEVDVDPFGVGDEAMEVEDEFVEEPVGGEETVEVDVTDIVDKAEETRSEIEGITSKMEELMGNLEDLSTKVTGMDQVIDKIDNLEKEIEKRNPTPVERLEMRSMDSFPYSIKLTDFWSDKEGYNTGEEEAPQEDYTLTQKDVDDYSEAEIKDSFDYDENDEDY